MNGDELSSNFRHAAGIVLGYAAGRYHLSTDQVGAIMSDVGYVGAAIAFGYNMFAHWGMKKVPVNAVTAGFLAIAVALGFGVSTSRAADIAGKAAPVPYVSSCSLTSCSGLYAGFNFEQAGANADLIQNGLSGFASNDFSAGLQVGYEIYNGQWRLGVEASGNYGISQNGPMPGFGNNKLWSAEEVACIGYSLAPLFGFGTSSSNTATINLPATLANALMTPCVLIGSKQRAWGAGLVSGVRASALIAKGWTLDADYQHINYNNANINPTLSQQTENVVRMGLNYHF